MIRAGTLLTALLLGAVANAQQAGTLTAESHPKLTSQKCTKSGGCVTQSTSVVLDANWRWLHSTSGSTNCFTGSTWDTTLCPDPVTCSKNCALDGADYSGTYGITSTGDALTLKFVTGSNVGSRVYLLENDTTYKLFKLKNQEFTFDVDMSQLPCGLNGAVYLSEMAADGGMSKSANNKAGAKYGTGYCDAQCPHDIKFINGEANNIGWNDSGSGQYGSCCSEMDIWEANSQATAYTPHPCTSTGLSRCSGTSCDTTCDKAGCDFNSYRMGDQSFIGVGKTVDTSKKITVVTQFITTDGTASGDLSEIRRIYIQNGKVIQNSQSKIPGVTGNSLTDSFCAAQKSAFSDANDFKSKGGMKGMGAAMDRGMVLTLSIWDDHSVQMLWLDSAFPTDKDPSAPGVTRGPCARTSGKPSELESQSPNASVTYSNLRYGDIGSTYSGTSSPGSSAGSSSTTKVTSTSTSAPPTSTGTVGQWGQCGGIGYTGPTVCVSPYTCTKSNDYYSQCL